MPNNYTGNPSASHSPSAAPGTNVAPVVQLPVGTDGFSAAAWDQALETLADFIAWLTSHGVWRDIASTISAAWSITGLWTFTERAIFRGSSGDTNFPIDLDATPTTRKGAIRIALNGSGSRARFYAVTGTSTTVILEKATGCFWTGTDWQRDESGSAPTLWCWSPSATALLQIFQYTGAGTNWATNAWDRSATINLLAAGLAITGSLTTSGSVTAGNGVTISAGGLSIVLGGATMAGDMTARRVISNGTQMTAGNIALGSFWGSSATKTVVTGSTDWRGAVDIGSAGTGQASGALVDITYQNGAFAATPWVKAWVTNTTAGTAPVTLALVSSSITFCRFSYSGVPVAGQTYRVYWEFLG